MKYVFITISIILLVTNLFSSVGIAQAVEPEIHAVLFYSPSCPHCHEVITEFFPELFEEYGNSLVIIGIDVSYDNGSAIYEAAVERYEIPQERFGVPTLIVGDTVLVGSAEIPEKFPGIVSEGLSSGGIAWPDIPGLEEILIEQGLLDQKVNDNVDQVVDETNNTAESDLSEENSASKYTELNQNTADNNSQDTSNPGNDELLETNKENSMALNSENNTDDYRYTTSNESVDFYSKILLKFNQDVGGNSLAVIVLFLMVIGVIYGGITYVTDATIKPLQFPKWTIPLLTVAGLFIAVYLSYIEFTRSEAVCGPVGDCNTVQESPYAYLFGIVPIGLIGVVGYFSILIMWFLETFGPKSIRRFSSISVWLMALIGILFSIYLTFIEPFVIGATCAWCIASAIIMTLIFLASTQSLIEINPSK